MKGLDRRLRHLEASSGINEPCLAVIVRTRVPRANDGAEDPGPVWATVIAGPNRGLRLIRADGEALGLGTACEDSTSLQMRLTSPNH